MLVAEDRRKSISQKPASDKRPKFSSVYNKDLQTQDKRKTIMNAELGIDAAKDELNESNYSSRKRNFDDLAPMFHLDPKLEVSN